MECLSALRARLSHQHQACQLVEVLLSTKGYEVSLRAESLFPLFPLLEMKRSTFECRGGSADDNGDRGRRERQRKDSERYWEGRKAAVAFDEYAGDNSETNSSRPVLSVEEVDKLCSFGAFDTITEETKKKVYNRGKQNMSIDAMERVVCAVCDCGVPRLHVIRCRPQGRAAERWVLKLRASENVPDALKVHYGLSHVNPELYGALLSPSGAEKRGGMQTGYIYVCPRCHVAMKNGQKPPKFSIANGFDIGSLPAELQEANSIEHRLTSLTALVSQLTMLKGGRHRAITGHVSVVHMNPVAIAERLPQLLEKDKDQFLVVLASPLTPLQREMVMKRHTARVSVIRDLLKFYLKNNDIYISKGVIIDEGSLQQLERMSGQVGMTLLDTTLAVDSSDLNTAQDGETKKNTSEQDGDDQSETTSDIEGKEDQEKEEVMYKETASIHIDGAPHTTVEALKTARETLLVRSHGSFVSDYEKDLLGLAFPDL